MSPFALPTAPVARGPLTAMCQCGQLCLTLAPTTI